MLHGKAARNDDGIIGWLMALRNPGQSKRKGSSMTSENSGFDVEQFAQEGLDDAGVTQDEVADDPQGSPTPADTVVPKTDNEPPSAEQPPSKEAQDKETSTDAIKAALQATEPSPTTPNQPQPEPESTIAELLPKQQETLAEPEARKPDHKVPLEDHIKLRERAQKAERERDEAIAKFQVTTQQQIQEIEPLDKWIADNPEDAQISPPPAAVLQAQRKFELAQQQRRLDAQRAADEARRQAFEANRQLLTDAQSKKQRAEESEKVFRSTHPDYTKLTNAVIKANLLSKKEQEAILDSENPGQALYDLAKTKLTAIHDGLGITTPISEPQPKPAKTTLQGEEEEEPEMTDDEIFTAIFAKPKPS